MSLKASVLAIALIKFSEGFSPVPYDDGVGKQTIGYGHLIRPWEKFDRIDRQQAEELLAEDLEKTEFYVKKIVKVPLDQNQFDALVSFVFNFGPEKVRKSHTIKRLNHGDYSAVEKRLPLWNKGTRNGKKVVMPGLVTRRANEVKLWKGELSLSDIPNPNVR